MEVVGNVLRAVSIGSEDLQHARHDLGGFAFLEADALHLSRKDDAAAALVMRAGTALGGDGFQHGLATELAVSR